MLALADPASLTPYVEEDGLVLASVGEGDTDTPTPVGTELLPLIWDMPTHTIAQATSHSMSTHIDIHELTTTMQSQNSKG